MISILALIAFIYLIFANRSNSSRIDEIELKLKNGGLDLKKSVPATHVGEILKDASEYGTQNQAKLEHMYENPATLGKSEPDQANKFSDWLKEDWLMKLGAFLFIVGFGWFVSYAFANNWIGPVGRISIGIVAGVIIMALGFKRMMKYPAQGAVFMALGGGMAMLTVFAGISIYAMFTPLTAVIIDFVIVAFISFASYKFQLQTLATVAQVLAFAVPILAAGQTDSVFLFSYLLVVSIATLFLASVTGWRNLITSSLVFVGIYSLPYIFGSSSFYYNDAPLILNFAYVFALCYLFSGMFAIIQKGVTEKKNEITLAALNGIFLFLWIYNVAPKEWNVIIYSISALIFAITSFTVYKYSEERAPFYAYGSVAVAFIAAATAAQLDGATLVIAFTLEVLLLVLSILMLTEDPIVAAKSSWLFVVPLFLSVENLSKYSYSKDLFSADFYVLIIIAIALIICGRLINHFAKEFKKETEMNYGSVLIVLGTFYVMYIVWQFVHILIASDQDMATMTTLIIYTICGLIAYFNGLYTDDKARRTYGVALLVFVVVRLIFIDVWNMELFGRVVTFLAIGVLLMSTAFLTKKKKHEIS